MDFFDSQGPRAQIDRSLYREGMQNAIKRVPNLDVLTSAVEDIVLGADGIEGVKLGETISAGS